MIELRHLTKTYRTRSGAVTVLDDVDLTVERGEIAAVVGPSGAGKSTLAKCVNLLERPSSGEVIVGSRDLTALPAADLRRARQSIGTVFQGSNLLRRRTAAQNIALPLAFLGVTQRQITARVDELLDMVGLGDKAHSYPAQLSGGQRQRVGIARALALKPSVLLSDESTSGLDPASTASILELLRRVRDEFDLSVILITHEMDVVREIADTVSRIEHGRIVERGPIAGILTNPRSSLARELIPGRASAAPVAGHAAWEAVYGRFVVRPDWLVAASEQLGTSIGVLSATVERVDGETVGRLLLSVDSALDHDLVQRTLETFGLHAALVSHAARELRTA
jgi:ABC-type methionine transport system ATPase subunit